MAKLLMKGRLLWQILLAVCLVVSTLWINSPSSESAQGPPSITSVTPATGPTTGGTVVTISGAGLNGTIGTCTFNGVSLAGLHQGTGTDGKSTYEGTTPASSTTGYATIVITTVGGTATNSTFFTYFNPMPTLTSISPAAGSPVGGTVVTITGTNFSGATAVTFGGTAAAGYTVNSATSITATTPVHAAASVDVSVTNSYGTGTKTGGFEYTLNIKVTSISPAAGPKTGGTAVTVFGANFVSEATVKIGGGSCTGVAWVDSNHLTASTPSGSAGAKNVVVTNPDTSSSTLIGGFTYFNAPTTAGISPASGSTIGGTTVTITGTNFVVGATTVTFDTTGVTPTSVTTTQIICTAPAHAAGAVDVTVTTPGGSATLAGGFTYAVNVILGKPEADSITMSLLNTGNADFYIQYGKAPGIYDNQTNTISLLKDTPLEIQITGLNPDTTYYYRICYRPAGDSVFHAGDEAHFSTQRAIGKSFVFTIDADPHWDSNVNPDKVKLAFQNILNENPDFNIDMGDTSMTEKQTPALTNYQAADSLYLDRRNYFSIFGSSVPLYMVLGNHDGEMGWVNNGSSNCLAVWSANARTKYLPNPLPDSFYSGNNTSEPYVGLRGNYYSWTWGSALFVVLDPYWYTTASQTAGWDWTLGKTQFDWLKNTLAANNQAQYKFVFAHQLVGGFNTPNDGNGRGGVEAANLYEWGASNTDFNDNRTGWGGESIRQLLEDYNTTAFFHGHDHLFAYQQLNGVVYQDCPQPGEITSNDSRSTYGYSQGVIMPSSGHLRVTVADSVVTVDYIKTYMPGESPGHVNGEIAYSYTITSTSPPPPTVTGISPASGPTAGGTSVTISGTNFTGATAVSFGATAASSYTVDNGTQITATAPAGSNGNVHVTVTTAGGISAATSADQFTYIVPTATVNFTLTLQGGGRLDAGYIVPLTFKFFDNSTGVPGALLYTFTVNTTRVDTTYQVTDNVTGINPGTYDISAVTPHCLTNVKTNVVITTPTTAVNLGTLMEGNANDDNLINITDFGVLAAAYGKNSGDGGYDARADFDRSGIVNITDFGLLAANYGKSAPVAVP